MRRDDLFLADIVDCAQAVAGYIEGLTYEAFMGSPVVRDAVLLRLTNVGEACGAISEELKASHPEVPWQKVKAFRNLAVHAYFSVDWQVVWGLATVRLPDLEVQIAKILDEDD